MPLDYSIIGDVKPIPISTPLQLEEQQVKLEQVKAQRKAAIDAAREQGLLQQAFQQHTDENGVPDFKAIIGTLYQNQAVGAATKVQDLWTKQQEAASKQAKAEEDAHEQVAKELAQQFNGVTESSYPMARAMWIRTHPGANVPQQFDPQWVALTAQAGTGIKEQNDQVQAARKELMSGDAIKGAGMIMSNATDRDSWDDHLHQVAMFSPEEYQKYKRMGFSPQSIEAAKQATMTPEKQAELAGQAEARKTAAENTAADNARADEQLKIARGNLAVSQGHLQIARQQAATPSATGGVSDVVSGYVQQLKADPAFTIAQVPAAGGMRNAVISQLRKEGYNLTQPLTSQTRARIETAQAIEPLVGKVLGLAEQINKLGLMGTVSGRWRSLLSKESSASSLSGLTADQKQLVGQFVTESGLLASGVAMVHGGSRGGGSPQLLEQLKPLLEAGNKDLDTYIGNLRGAHEIVTGYANMGKKPDQGGGSGTAEQRPIPGIPGGVAELRNGKWIRIK